MRLKSAPGLTIRDPISKRILADAGEEKPASAYWIRRLRDGDVVECAPPAVAAPPADVVQDPQIPDSTLVPSEGDKQ